MAVRVPCGHHEHNFSTEGKLHRYDCNGDKADCLTVWWKVYALVWTSELG